MRALFFGTPAIAVPSLHALAELGEIAAVVCQPDRPAGRGLVLRAPAVKMAAEERGWHVEQPTRVRTPEFAAWVESRRVDLALVIAYGRILPPAVLAAPRLGCLNLHASLLPAYRGAAPIQRALMNGERRTGVSLMQMEEGLDTGPVFSSRELDIDEDDDSGSLFEKLGLLAAELVRRDLPRLLRGELTAIPQDETRATHAPPLGPEDTPLDFSRSTAEELAWRVRGLSPRPGATARLLGDRPTQLRVLRARPLPDEAAPGGPALEPGVVLVEGGRVSVGTRAGRLEILTAQLEGKRALPARDLVNGRALKMGDRLA